MTNPDTTAPEKPDPSFLTARRARWAEQERALEAELAPPAKWRSVSEYVQRIQEVLRVEVQQAVGDAARDLLPGRGVRAVRFRVRAHEPALELVWVVVGDTPMVLSRARPEQRDAARDLLAAFPAEVLRIGFGTAFVTAMANGTVRMSDVDFPPL